MLRIAVAIVLAGLAGCSSLFGLDSPTLARDASNDTASDGAPLDASPDAADPDGPAPAACPAGYTAVSDGFYRQVNQQTTWLQAAMDCADDGGTGGKHTHLIVFDDMQELSGANVLVTTDIWIGLSDRVTEASFLWVTAQNTNNFPPASGSPWEAGSPGGGGAATDDCVILRQAGLLSETACGNNRRYVCECDDFANDPARY